MANGPQPPPASRANVLVGPVELPSVYDSKAQSDISKDFQGLSSIDAKDQVQSSAGFEYEVSPGLALMFEVLGRYQRGAGRVG